tara:strand:+ start:119 stop:1021 length:903 start_codon:yes stop_codon:yes gene_type:complete
MKAETYLDKGDLDNIQHRVISYGAGTQSTAMLLMGLTGELHAKPDFGVFADTGGEPKEVYDYLYLIKDYVKKEFDFDIIIVKKKGNNIVDDLLNPKISKHGNVYIPYAPPLFIKHTEGGKNYMINRYCTTTYKIEPFHRYIKKRLHIKRNNPEQSKMIEQWMGISMDEMQRMRTSRDWYLVLRYPLVEMEMVRNESIRLVERFGLPTPPRSACTFCPYHNVHQWKSIKKNFPDEFQEVIEFEKQVQERLKEQEKKGKSTYKGVPYFHSSCKPIGEVNFGEEQYDLFGDGFLNECDGLCGI